MDSIDQNPWHVPTLDKFLFYCCPECDFKTKEQSGLFDHALETHESSHESLVSLSSNNIKKEPPEERNKSNFEFNCNECSFASEDLTDINYHLAEHSSRIQDIEMLEEGSKCKPDIEQWLDTTIDIKEESIEIHPKKKSKKEKVNVSATGIFPCEHCGQSFDTRRKMKVHINRVHNPKNTCDLCGRIFRSCLEMEKHKKGQHFGELAFECKQCDFKTSTEGRLKIHKRKEHDKVSLEVVCHLCGVSLNKNSMKSHLEKKHSDTSKQVMCDICGKTIKETNLYIHKRSHFKYFICTICDNVFKSKTAVIKHLQEAHQVFCNKNNMYACVKCKDKFATSKLLASHLISEHQLKSEHKCSKCDSWFPTKTLVTVHLLECHEHNPFKDDEILNDKLTVVNDQKPFKCDICDTRFTLKRTMAIHMKQKHFTDNHIKCAQCDFTAYSDYVLKKHFKEVHAPKILFPCTQCSYSTNHKTELKYHIERIHGDGISKRYPCFQCQSEFKSKEQMREHLLIEHKIVYKT